MSGLRINAVKNHNTTTQSASAKVKVKDTNNEKHYTEMLIGGLSALAILGTGIYFAVRHKKALSGNRFKTIVKKDGSMERLFPNGNLVNIKNISNNDGGWSKTITVTDSKGKKISERYKFYCKNNDRTRLEIETRKAFNSEDEPLITTLKTINKSQDKIEIRNNESYYNEKWSSDEENLIKSKFENIITDKQGKTISESIENKVRNNFGAFDEEFHGIEYSKDGTISTDNGTRKYLEENLRRSITTRNTVDANGNVLFDYKQDTLMDKNTNMLKDLYQIDSYKIDADGKRVLKSSNLIKSEGFEDNYTSYYSRGFDKGIYNVKDYVRDENGIGTLIQYNENLDGSIIENSRKRISGVDVLFNTYIK